MHIYTDGSAIEGEVGAAAVAPRACNPKQYISKAYMGTENISTVYAAELQGVYMAMNIAIAKATTNPIIQKIIIFTDNQASITSTAEPKTQSGQYILKRIVENIDQLRQRGNIALEIRWIPAHRGVSGNELADAVAKEASGWSPLGPGRGSKADLPEDLQTLISSSKMLIHRRAIAEWEQIWDQSTRGRATRRLNPKPTKKVLIKYTGLRRAMAACLVQMRTGKIALAGYLHAIGRANTNRCSCQLGIQTVRRVLLECPNWKDLRTEIWGTAPRGQDLAEVLGDPLQAKTASYFMLRTGLIGQFRMAKVRNDDPNQDID